MRELKTADTSIMPRILLAVVIIALVVSVQRGVVEFWRHGELAPLDTLLVGGGILIGLIALVVVIVQRFKMRDTETFRREKW